ncbi:BTB/POZ fold protein [Akanthomyces lecanii RCEF 1005]|uniref:BTB/POZ fold protein n=1 Tax=Akanthomyces lecanii RCEF 1005 TaxID=1081108 RepID=A0A162K9D4_CORDF|nr:BTB/POZ fold protein [Akanthomyces lecanii RCEF 1005]
MAEIEFGSILSSKPCRFLIGPQKREFFIHASLAASQSPVIDSLVNGSMKEATSGCTVWENVDEDTFVRFGQYVYTRNYEGSAPFVRVVPEPTAQKLDGLSENSVEPGQPAVRTNIAESNAPEPSDDNFWGNFTISSSKALKKGKKKKDRLANLLSDFDEEVENLAPVVPSPPTSPQTRKTAWDSFQTQRSYECGVAGPHLCPINKDSQSEYKDVFLSHARVHAMAACYGIEALAQLALHKLHQILCQFTLHEDRICDLVALLRYCYEADERPLLRELVSAFAACHAKRLWTSTEFQELFAAHGELSLAVMGNIVERMQ